MGRVRLLALVCLAAACTQSDASVDVSGAARPKAPEDALRGDLVVFAAASLTDAFGEIERAFERVHPEVNVVLSFAGSQSLRTQIQNGAMPAVFASANERHMEALRAEGLVDDPVVFAENSLVVVTPAANPAGLRSFEDLPRAGKIVLAGENVPAGVYAARALELGNERYGADFAARVSRHVASRETDVRQALQKVILGEADAAIVYTTDAAAVGGDVSVIEIPAAHNVRASYPIATVPGSKRRRLARTFIDFLRSDVGQARLRAHGFAIPAGGGST